MHSIKYNNYILKLDSDNIKCHQKNYKVSSDLLEVKNVLFRWTKYQNAAHVVYVCPACRAYRLLIHVLHSWTRMSQFLLFDHAATPICRIFWCRYDINNFLILLLSEPAISFWPDQYLPGNMNCLWTFASPIIFILHFDNTPDSIC